MKTIQCKDRFGIVHHYNPRYVVDAYVIPSEFNKDWCLTIIFGKDSGMSPSIETFVFHDKKTCDEQLDAILAAIESIK